MSAPALPAPRPSYIGYAVVDVVADPQELVKVALSRREGREFVQWREDADRLRIRRAEVKLFNT